MEYRSQFYLSYNGDITTTSKKRVELIKHSIDIAIASASSNSQKVLLGLYLTFNMEFMNLVKTTRNHVDADSRDLLERFIHTVSDTKNDVDSNIKKIKDLGTFHLDFDKLIGDYHLVLDHLNTPELRSHLDAFFRPMQDASKIFFYLSKNYEKFDITVLSNEGLHAEYNVAHHFPKVEFLDKKYIGVAKLCCGYCHKSLTEDGYLHRGTHGLCDDEWHMSSSTSQKVAFPTPPPQKVAFQEAAFKASTVEIMEFDQKATPSQHRKLSTDIFENRLVDFFLLKSKLFVAVASIGSVSSSDACAAAGGSHTESVLSLPLVIADHSIQATGANPMDSID